MGSGTVRGLRFCKSFPKSYRENQWFQRVVETVGNGPACMRLSRKGRGRPYASGGPATGTCGACSSGWARPNRAMTATSSR